jgi:hypothetical protein
MAAKKKKDEPIVILPIRREIIKVTIEGTSQLVIHGWSLAEKDKIKDKQTGKAEANAAMPPRDPEAEFEAARHLLADGRDGIAAVSIKLAMVSAVRNIQGLNMSDMRQAFFSLATCKETDLIAIECEGGPTMREDMVRIKGGPAIPRWRPEYWPWSATFDLEVFDPLTVEQALNLLERAGQTVGLGENRPEKSGNTWGRFRVKGTSS